MIVVTTNASGGHEHLSDDCIDATSALASSTLARWRQVVQSVLLTAGADSDRTALRGLASWYERMCVDHCYTNAPPEEGVTALIAMSNSETATIHARLAVTYQAVRIAQALGAYRRLWLSGDYLVECHRGVLAQLELALEAASELRN